MKKEHHYFIGEATQPFHLSVGALVMNTKDQVLCHHFSGIKDLGDVYSLMRATIKPNESLGATLMRGLAEEFGVRARIANYLGSIKGKFVNWEGATIEKTTLYFLCGYEGENKGIKRKDEVLEDKKSTIEWIEMDALIAKMKSQARIFKRTDYDESSILEKAKPFITQPLS